MKKQFDALKMMSPQTLHWELGDVMDGRVEIRLWQRYSLGPKEVDMFENIVVQHENGKITSMEDRWKGVPFRQYPPFTWCRRLNGLMSEYLSSRLERSDDKAEWEEEEGDLIIEFVIPGMEEEDMQATSFPPDNDSH